MSRPVFNTDQVLRDVWSESLHADYLDFTTKEPGRHPMLQLDFFVKLFSNPEYALSEGFCSKNGLNASEVMASLELFLNLTPGDLGKNLNLTDAGEVTTKPLHVGRKSKSPAIRQTPPHILKNIGIFKVQHSELWHHLKTAYAQSASLPNSDDDRAVYHWVETQLVGKIIPPSKSPMTTATAELRLRKFFREQGTEKSRAGLMNLLYEIAGRPIQPALGSLGVSHRSNLKPRLRQIAPN